MSDVEEIFRGALEAFRAGEDGRAALLAGEALKRDPDHPESLLLVAVLEEGAGRLNEAMGYYARVSTLRPTWPGPWTGMGNLLRMMGRLEEAVEAHRRAVTIQPAFAAGWVNLGAALESRRQYEAALEAYERALALDPGQFMAWYNKGVSLAALGRTQEAEAAYREAIRLNAGVAPAHNNLGSLREKAGDPDGAIAGYREALRLSPDSPQALNNLGCLLHRMGSFEESEATFRRALALYPRFALAHSNLLYLLLFCPGVDALRLKTEHARWNEIHARPVMRPRGGPRAGRAAMPRLRVGYVSADLRDHVVGRNMLPILRQHDPGAVEVFIYSCTARTDEMTRQFQALAAATGGGWRDISGMDDDHAAALIEQDGIDILVDLSLHMANNRLLVFARKPAPVQMTFAGYPGTTGLEAIDYRISDPHLDPLPSGHNAGSPPAPTDALYAEQTLRLPATFWVYDPLGIDIAVADLPAARKGFITFGCLNNFCKINQPTLKRWARVMRRVEGSRLMLLAEEGSHRGRTIEVLAAEGISPDRVTFSAPLPREAYLRLYHQIDIGLDSLPYNGHTTTLDALWMGVPVMTQVGETVVGRAGLSQLRNLSLDELVAWNDGEFVDKAVQLAVDLGRLADLRRTLRGRLMGSVLADAAGLARGLEGLYRQAWDAHAGGNA